MRKRIIANNQIRSKEVRLIDKEGKQLGVFPLQEALKLALKDGLDLIQVTEKVDPPICKIMQYGKYAYQVGKKEKGQKHTAAGELKSIRLTFGISPHDMETRAKAAHKFLEKGYKIRIEMRLRGREKYLGNFSREKMQKFLETLRGLVPIKIEKELSRQPRGLTMIIAKDQQQQQHEKNQEVSKKEVQNN